ncbi:hypothetical protein SESBI_20422 [Sesbania bispinosa]|nr:hypothetical protein SESBI_20422 [Sesbania bispinosa]
MLPERATSGVNEEPDILSGVLGIQEKQLADDCICNEVINAVPQEHDSLLQQQTHHVPFRASHRRRGRLRRRRQQLERRIGLLLGLRPNVGGLGSGRSGARAFE